MLACASPPGQSEKVGGGVSGEGHERAASAAQTPTKVYNNIANPKLCPSGQAIRYVLSFLSAFNAAAAAAVVVR